MYQKVANIIQYLECSSDNPILHKTKAKKPEGC